MFKSDDTILSGKTDDRVQVRLKTLIDLATAAAGLKQRRSEIKSRQSGNYVSHVKGRGMEFDETRLYQPGDDIRSIDWRVTARTGKPHTKLYREERERPVFISVDNRAAMHFATRGVFKSVQAAKLAALLAWLAQHHGDRVGGQIYSDLRCLELKPQNGRHAVLRFFNALLQPLNGETEATTLQQVIARLARHVRPGSLIYLISDFRGFNEQIATQIAKMALHCDIVMLLVYDPLESALPGQGRYRFTDTVNDVWIDTCDRSRILTYQQRFHHHRQQLRDLADKMRLGFVQCSTTDDPARILR